MEQTKDFRELSAEEIIQVSGGGSTSTYTNGTTTVTESYDSAGNFLGATYDHADHSGAYFDSASNSLTNWNAPNLGTGSAFGCLGVSAVLAGGLCYSGGHVYAYGGVAGPGPVDITLGTSADSAAYLQGLSVSGNGLPGAGVSFNSNGTVSAIAWTTGTPGVQATYGVDLNKAINAFVSRAESLGSTFSSGFYNMAGQPYSPTGPATYDRMVTP